MTTYLGKSCSFGLPRAHFVNCRQFMYLVISFLVLRAGCGIRLYQFLIIAYPFTLYPSDSSNFPAIALKSHQKYDRSAGVYMYEGCSGSSWNLVIKCSNIDILHSYFEISQVDIIELAPHT